MEGEQEGAPDYADRRAELDQLKRALLAPAEFDPAEFLASTQKDMPLKDLQEYLQRNYTSIQDELLEAINANYNDFISLSSGLVGVDQMIETVRTPVEALRTEAALARDAVGAQREELEGMLNERGELNARRQQLVTLRECCSTVRQLEELLELEKPASSPQPTWAWSKLDDKRSGRVQRALELERVGAAATRVSKVTLQQLAECPLKQALAKRLERVGAAFRKTLDSLFTGELRSPSEAIQPCLRAYLVTGAVARAEQVVREAVVKPIVTKNVAASLLGRSKCEGLPKIYDTVYTELCAQLQPLLSLGGSSTAAPVSIFLDPIDAEFLADTIEDQPSSSKQCSTTAAKAFSFVRNSVWPEVARAVQHNLKPIFAPGIPEDFHRNFSVTMEFTTRLEALCQSKQEAAGLCTDSSYRELMNMWNLDIYFQLRQRAVLGDLEQEMRAAPKAAAAQDGPFLATTTVLCDKLSLLWSEKLFLQPLSGKFYHLHMQLLHLYSEYILNKMVRHAMQGASSLAANPTSAAASTLVPASPEAGEVFTMNHLPRMIGDLEIVACHLEKLRDRVCVQLQISQDGDSLQDSVVLKSYNAAVAGVREISTEICGQISARLGQTCSEKIQAIRGITTAFRMTSKPPPTRASPFVENFLGPLRSFCNGPLKGLEPASLVHGLKHQVVSTVCDAYAAQAGQLIESLRKTEDSLKRMRKGAQSEDNQTMSDTDKICLQLKLDSDDFGKQIGLLGVDAAGVPAYQALVTVTALRADAPVAE